MKAAYFEQPGPPEVIQFGDLPKPTATGSQVLVKIGAVAVNPIDTYIRGGAIIRRARSRSLSACDLAGHRRGRRPGGERFKAGGPRLGIEPGAARAAGDFRRILPPSTNSGSTRPRPSVRDEDAAAIALVGITAHLGLFRDAKLKAGETLFVNGGTGGVGSTVVQMAQALGARVVDNGGTDEKCQAASELGADVAINYKTDDVAARVKEFAPQGVNVCWETLREPNFEKIVRCWPSAGRLILMAGREARPTFPVGPFYVKGCSLHGFVMFMATADEQRAAPMTSIAGWRRASCGPRSTA